MSELELALPAVIVSTGGYVPSWLQQAWQSNWFRSSIMVSYECWVRLRGTIRATMADKTLSTPQRSEGPFHACPGAGRAAESWWPAGSLAPVQPNAISAQSCRPYGDTGVQGLCDTHTCTYMVAPVFSINRSSAWMILMLHPYSGRKVKERKSRWVYLYVQSQTSTSVKPNLG